MKARAPGKLVLSGAYAVLYAGPALVTAVDRYVVADTEREPIFRAPEVLAALAQDPRFSQREPPYFDASALRSGQRKLGLGSSAAITAASLAALELAVHGAGRPADPAGTGDYSALACDPADRELAGRVFPAALRAHQSAQPGGSGIDVAAACFGGSLLALQDAKAGLKLERVALPPGLELQVYWSGQPASTQALLGLVRSLEAAEPQRFAGLMDAQLAASHAAAEALRAQQPLEFLKALQGQCSALSALGDAAGAPIVGEALKALAASVDPEREAWLPAGAGGGDVSVRFSLEASTGPAASAIQRAGERLDLSLSARGVHAWS